MPVENEIKHVLSDPDGRLLAELEATLPSVEIDQFYVTPSNRFRKTVARKDGVESVKMQHTFKLMVGDRLLEIESDVSADDVALASLEARERVIKRRFSIDAPDAHWDIDFLFRGPPEEGGGVYFAMAECEFPEGGSYKIPSIIRPYIDFVVTRGFSGEFTNRLLANPLHITRVMREVAPRLRQMTAELELEEFDASSCLTGRA